MEAHSKKKRMQAYALQKPPEGQPTYTPCRLTLHKVSTLIPTPSQIENVKQHRGGLNPSSLWNKEWALKAASSHSCLEDLDLCDGPLQKKNYLQYCIQYVKSPVY